MAFIGKNSVTVTSLDSAESMSVVTDLTVDTNTLKVDSVSNRVGILNATPSVSLDIGTATDAIHIPVGTTGERPGSPTSGLFRYNTSLNQFEGYTSTWGAIGGGGTNTFTHDSFTGDNSTTDFVLSQATESENNLFVFIDGVFQTQDAYSIATNSGITTLTLSAAPAQDRKIIVYTVAAGVSGNNLNQNLFDANTSDAVDGVNDTFTLSIPPVNKNNTQVFFDGVYQHKANYSVSGTSLTFTDAPPLGVVVEVMIFTQTAVNVPVDNSVTSSKLSGDLVAPGNLTVTGYLAGPSTFILDPSAVGDNTGTLLVKGNLQVDGTQTIINSTTLTVDDLNITLASGAANALAADGAGITIDTGSDPDATITYDGVNDRWNFNKNVDVTGSVTADGLTVDGNPLIQGAQPYITLTDSVWTTGAVLRSGVNTLGTAIGDYFLINAPSGKGVSISTNNSNNLATFANTGDISFYEDTGTTAKLVWKAGDERLGIGIDSPASELHVKSSGISSDTLTIENSTGNGSWRVKEGGSSNALLQGYNASNSETIRLDPTSDTFFNGGNVGIGTSSPSTALHVKSASSVTATIEAGGGGDAVLDIKAAEASGAESVIRFSDSVSSVGFITYAQNDGGSDFMRFGTASTERMRIDSGGSVLIGKSTPTDLHNTWNHLIIGEKGAIISENGAGGIDGITLADNVYIDADTGNYAYQTTAAASQITQSGGVIAFSNAASGSTGAALTPVERMRIDTSGNVGIGRTPDANGVLQLNVAAGLNTNLTFAENSVNKWMIGSLTSSNALRFYDLANSREVMRLDASGFLNVGATGTAGTVVFKRSSDGNGAGAISVVGDDFVLNTGFASANMIFKNVTSESMRLDTSGNLLVGKTATGLANAGVEFTASNILRTTKADSASAEFNRTGTDGDIAIFWKDTLPVGSIGVLNSNNLTITGSVADHGGLQFATHSIVPMEAGVDSDGTIDLGSSGARFKDLYLSGGVRNVNGDGFNAATDNSETAIVPANTSGPLDGQGSIGLPSFRWKNLHLSGGVVFGDAGGSGTSSSNSLDSYEEGTWTPVYSGTTTAGTGTYTRQSGVYVKVGDLVYASCSIGISAHTGSGSAQVTGLPFASFNDIGNYAGISVSFNNGHTTTSGYQIIGFVQVSAADIKLYETGGTGQQNTLALDTAFTEFDFSIVYRAA